MARIDQLEARLLALESRPTCACPTCAIAARAARDRARHAEHRIIRGLNAAERSAAIVAASGMDRASICNVNFNEALALVADFDSEALTISLAAMPAAVADQVTLRINPPIPRVTVSMERGRYARTPSVLISDALRDELNAAGLGEFVGHGNSRSYEFSGVVLASPGTEPSPRVFRVAQLELLKRIDHQLVELIDRGDVLVAPMSRAESDAVTMREHDVRGERPKLLPRVGWLTFGVEGAGFGGIADGAS